MFKMEIVEKKGTSCRRLSQTKILEDRTIDLACDFKVLYAGVSTRFGLRIIENVCPPPNEDFGRSNKPFGEYFRRTFQRPILWLFFENLRLGQPYATHPLFLDNLHFDDFVKSVNLKSRLNYLAKSSKWRLSKKRGWVAYGWFGEHKL